MQRIDQDLQSLSWSLDKKRFLRRTRKEMTSIREKNLKAGSGRRIFYDKLIRVSSCWVPCHS
jgi:hypothetical protein